MRLELSGACAGPSVGASKPCFLGPGRTRLLPVKNLSHGCRSWLPIARGSWSQATEGFPFPISLPQCPWAAPDRASSAPFALGRKEGTKVDDMAASTHQEHPIFPSLHIFLSLHICLPPPVSRMRKLAQGAQVICLCLICCLTQDKYLNLAAPPLHLSSGRGTVTFRVVVRFR